MPPLDSRFRGNDVRGGGNGIEGGGKDMGERVGMTRGSRNDIGGGAG